MKKLTDEWISKAENDYIVAIREFKSKPMVSEAVCFHSQQCVEKYIKAILQENDVQFEKVHDLDNLLDSCKNFIPELGSFRNELIDLSTYAVDVRYPGFNISGEEAKECLDIMKKIRKIVKNYFNLK